MRSLTSDQNCWGSSFSKLNRGCHQGYRPVPLVTLCTKTEPESPKSFQVSKTPHKELTVQDVTSFDLRKNCAVPAACVDMLPGDASRRLVVAGPSSRASSLQKSRILKVWSLRFVRFRVGPHASYFDGSGCPVCEGSGGRSTGVTQSSGTQARNWSSSQGLGKYGTT